MAPTYDPLTNLVTPDTDAGTIALLAKQAATADELTPGKVYSLLNNDGGLTVIDTDEYAPRPRRNSDLTVAVIDAESFATYLNKHALDGETEIYAHRSINRFEAIINAGTESEPGWRDHSIILKLSTTKEWDAWMKYDGQLMAQAGFAEFLEDHAGEVVAPSSADMIELSTSLQVKRGVDFEQGTRLSNGEVQLSYRETTSASAGRAGQLSIPENFQLALTPYEGGEPYRVNAKFRYRLNGPELKLGYKLERVNDVVREAFDSIAADVQAHAEAAGAAYFTAS